ncbi:MAG: ankyrin repeat domain-containing protein [Verrucomicrobia bacterium]|nr:ankyrin repeat domain-containing protein [Verrucomicrobiota bacterium]
MSTTAATTQSAQRTPFCKAAIWSLVLGILGIPLFCTGSPIGAVICGHIARSKVRKAAGQLRGTGMALAGLITGYIGVALIALCLFGLFITTPKLTISPYTDLYGYRATHLAPSEVFSDPKVVALCVAVQQGNLAEIDRLISAGADASAVGKNGASPLMYAFAAKNKRVFLRLLERGADPNKHESDGPSITHLAAGVGNAVWHDSYWLEAVLRHGGDPNLEMRAGSPQARNPNDKTTPLHWAIQGFSTPNVKLLIQAGADLNRKDGLSGNTPAMNAAVKRMYEDVYLLLQAGADFRARNDHDLDLACYAVNDQPPVEGEARRWQDKVLAFLEQKGVDVEAARAKQAAKGIRTRGVAPGEVEKVKDANETVLQPRAVDMAALAGKTAGPKGAEEMKMILRVMQRDDPAAFEQVMRSFIKCAHNGDIDGMVALTSKVTITQTGLEKLKEHYAKDTMPALKMFPKMSDGGNVDYINDGKDATGWLFKKTFTSPEGKTVKLQFTVLKEQGKIGVSSFDLWE